jgi:hypothetical protein
MNDISLRRERSTPVDSCESRVINIPRHAHFTVMSLIRLMGLSPKISLFSILIDRGVTPWHRVKFGAPIWAFPGRAGLYIASLRNDESVLTFAPLSRKKATQIALSRTIFEEMLSHDMRQILHPDAADLRLNVEEIARLFPFMRPQALASRPYLRRRNHTAASIERSTDVLIQTWTWSGANFIKTDKPIAVREQQ